MKKRGDPMTTLKVSIASYEDMKARAMAALASFAWNAASGAHHPKGGS
jgi:hypothetical protein